MNQSLRWTGIAVFSGASMLTGELAAGKALFPFFGGSQMVWAGLLGVVMAALATGYFAGNALHRKLGNHSAWFLLMATGIWFLLLPWAGSRFHEIAFQLSGTSGYLLAALLFTAIPMFCLGALAPVQVAGSKASISGAGSVAGNFYFYSTLGSVAGALLTGFWILPAFGTQATFLAAGAMSLCAALLASSSKYHLPAATTLFVLFFYLLSLQINPALPQNILYRQSGIHGELIVADLPFDETHPRRLLLANRIGQTNTDPRDAASLWDYPHFLTTLAGMKKENSRALILGLAGGSLAFEFHRLHFKVDAVDLDPRTFEVARKYFSLPKEINFHEGDARHFLRKSQQRWDLVVLDLFSGESPPFHLLTLEAFELIKMHLAIDGMVLINAHGYHSGEAGKGLHAIARTLQECGYHVRFTLTNGSELDRNTLLVATLQPLPAKPVCRNNSCCVSRFNLFECPPLAAFPENKLKEAPLLTDDLPVLELLNAEAYSGWREYAIEHYLLELEPEGISYF